MAVDAGHSGRAEAFSPGVSPDATALDAGEVALLGQACGDAA